MTPSADGGQGTERRPDPVPNGGESLNEMIRDEIGQKQARRSLHGRRFSDGRVRGVEPLPHYSNPVHDYLRSRRGT